jgi:hypothetical protein
VSPLVKREIQIAKIQNPDANSFSTNSHQFTIAIDDRAAGVAATATINVRSENRTG